MKKTPSTWSVPSLQAYRQSRGWPELAPQMAEKVVDAIHDIQVLSDGQSFSSWAEPALLFQPEKRKVLDNG